MNVMYDCLDIFGNVTGHIKMETLILACLGRRPRANWFHFIDRWDSVGCLQYSKQLKRLTNSRVHLAI